MTTETTARTAKRVWVCQRSILITLPEVVEGPDETRDQIFINLWCKLSQQPSLGFQIGVRNSVATARQGQVLFKV